MPRNVTLDISKDGHLTVEANGFNGQGCTEATRKLLEALGSTGSVTLKPEYTPEVAQPADQPAEQG